VPDESPVDKSISPEIEDDDPESTLTDPDLDAILL
jgi:hypothetical protein